MRLVQRARRVRLDRRHSWRCVNVVFPGEPPRNSSSVRRQTLPRTLRRGDDDEAVVVLAAADAPLRVLAHGARGRSGRGRFVSPVSHRTVSHRRRPRATETDPSLARHRRERWIRHGEGGAQVHLPRRRDDSYPRALAYDRRARVRPNVGPHEPLERRRARVGFKVPIEVVPVDVGGVDLGARLPVVDPAPVLEPRHDPRHRCFARGVARRVAAASKRPEPRRRAREDPQPRRGDAVASGKVHRGDVAQRASRRERGDARVGDASAAASARVDDRRGLVHERAKRGVVQAPSTPRHRQQRVSHVTREVPERLPAGVDELVDVPREEVGDDPLERLGRARTTGARGVGHRAPTPRARLTVRSRGC